MAHQIFRYVLLLVCLVGINCDDPEVEIPQGRLRGGTRTNIDGGTYYSFQSIPFAKPPIGELRFKAPQPAEGWEGIRDATEDVPFCIRNNFGSSLPLGQEDCLYLNVYTPELPGENTSKKAVMVWIHGGTMIYSAAETFFGAQFLLSKDVVLVTINYRLTIFGTFSVDDPDLGVTGNGGNKDQVMALKWIQENIEYFGGDPDNVLIFGQSAGGRSSHLHVLSPMSKGLFHKAVIHSGTALNDDIISYHSRNNGLTLAEEMGVQTDNLEEMLLSLQQAKAEDVLAAATSISSAVSFMMTPIVEIASNEPVFLPDKSINIIRSGDYNDVRLMMGYCNSEGITRTRQALASGATTYPITDFTQFIPGDLELEPGSEEEADAAGRLRKFYYGDAEVTDNITSAVELYTDLDNYPTYRSIVEHLKAKEDPIYFYYFTADTTLNPSKQGTNITYPGAAHEDELAYLFHSSTTPEYEAGSVEDLAIRNMVNLWTNFAIYGNPTPDDTEDYKWLPVQSDEFHYLSIGSEETISEDGSPTPAAFHVWAGLHIDFYPEN